MHRRRGVSWILGAGVAALTAVGLVAGPLADAEAKPPPPPPLLGVTMRIEPGTPAAFLVSVLGGRLGLRYDSLDAVTASVPYEAIAILSEIPGVVEITLDAAPDVNAGSEPVPVDGGDEPIGFVDADHDHGEGGRSFGALDLTNLAVVVDATRGWRESIGTGVDVALIDTGVAPVAGLGPVVNGPDLSFDGANPAMTYLDAYGHGTHLAGIINGDTAAAPGLAPGARVVNIRVGAADGAVDVSQVIAAIDWAVQHRNQDGLNIRVLVLAYGTDGTQPAAVDPLAAAVENAWRNGIVVVAAAGNRGGSAVSLDNPALDPWIVAVGASEPNGTYTTADDTVAPFTNRGSAARGVDVLAPGRSVVSLRVPGSFVDVAHPEGQVGPEQFRGSGTSQAAAVVGAAAAILLGARPELTPDQVKFLLESTARRLPRVDAARQGAGVIDVGRAARARAPRAAQSAQPFVASDGSGTLEGARGTYHVTDPLGTVLGGELTVWDGQSWSGQSWSGQSWSGQSWSGGGWTGQSWSGQSWSGGAWLGQSWSGQSWSGQSWSGQSWSGQSWSGQSWSGQSWSGQSWSGQSWSGQSWSGQSWSGHHPATTTSTSTTSTTSTSVPATTTTAPPPASSTTTSTTSSTTTSTSTSTSTSTTSTSTTATTISLV